MMRAPEMTPAAGPTPTNDFRSTLRGLGIIPVAVLARPDEANPLAEGLLAAGLPIAEITFRTAAAADAIALLRERHPSILVGAGTILSIEQADVAIDAGARFVVSPGLNPAVVDHVLGRGIPMLPGVYTPSEIETALAHGIDVVKLFPAAQAGGPDYVRALAGPYRTVGFVPLGGISPANLAEYLALPSVVACGGTWLAKADVLARGDVAEIERLAHEAVTIVREARA